jgi:hypothetical protein
MERLKITPGKQAQSGRWKVRSPAGLSGTGEREQSIFRPRRKLWDISLTWKKRQIFSVLLFIFPGIDWQKNVGKNRNVRLTKKTVLRQQDGVIFGNVYMIYK